MKWIKDYLFSIFMFAVAIAITLFVLIGYFEFASDDDFIYALLIINCLSPVILMIFIGVICLPRKEKDNE